MIKELNAITAADDLGKFLKDHPRHLASVHSAFPHAVNLLVDEDELITLTSHSDITPMGLTVEPGVDFTNFLQAGDQVYLECDRFTALNGTFTVNLQDKEVWETGLMMDLDARSVGEVAQIRLDLIHWLARQPSEGLLPLLPRLTHAPIYHKPANDNIYSRYIANDLEAFSNAINMSAWERALMSVDKLVGFGMGSTPSCDDFLAACLAVFKVAESLQPGCFPWIREFNQAIASKSKSRTTLVSANMLRHAADGRLSRSHQQLVQTCLFTHNAELEQLANQVLQHGATSGGDFLLGLVCALEWYQTAIKNTKKEGERAWVEINQSQPVPGI